MTVEELSERIINENDEKNVDDISHYGVKGMKWGVRKEYVPHPRKTGTTQPESSYSNRSKKQEQKRKINYKKAIAITAGGVGLGVATYLGYKYLGKQYIRSHLGSSLMEGASIQGEKFYRSFINKDRDVTLKSGTTFQRIATGDNAGFTKNVYMTYKSSDKDLYKGVFGWMKLRRLDAMNEDPILKELTLKAKEDIKLPSMKTRLSEFKELFKENPEKVSAFINEHEHENYLKRASKGAKDAFKGKTYSVDNDTDLRIAYRRFNDALSMVDRAENADVVWDYYGRLGKKGYNAIADENDIRLGTFKAKAPIIMFDTSKSIGDISVRELAAGEVLSSYDRTLVPKLVRQAVQPSGFGSENLTPDTAKVAKKYAEQIVKDRNALSSSYTMADLAKDFGRNNLTTSQIRSVSKLMESGMSHDEAVGQVIGLGNVALNKLFKKLKL